MTTLNIVYYPSLDLTIKSKPVDFKIDQDIKVIVQDMFSTMYVERGIGLAAPQIGINKQFFIVDVDSKKYCFINPTIQYGSEIVEMTEGCISVPGYRCQIPRPKNVFIKANNEHGDYFELNASGLLSRCIQHEYDHLLGILLIDRFEATMRKSTLLQRRALRKLQKQYRENKAV